MAALQEEAAIIAASVEEWRAKVEPALASIRRSLPATVRLVAVSKFKPAEAVRAAYDCGQRDFGENYVQEVVEKSSSPALAGLPDLRFRFIGRLQSNKCGALVRGVRQLSCVETVETEKVARKLDAAVGEAVAEGLRAPGDVLDVMVQVNSSGEPQKGGVETSGEALRLARFIARSCPHLHLTGLMTIGRADYTAGPENFACLEACREAVAAGLGSDAGGGAGDDEGEGIAGSGGDVGSNGGGGSEGIVDGLGAARDPEQALELSMGMSADYLVAVEHGSTNVRIGSTIFGSR